MDNIVQNIANLITNELNTGNGLEITKDTKFIEAGVDSVALMMLFVLLEEQYGFETDEDALVGEDLTTVGNLAEYVYKRLN
jgi:acyl carrier protein